MHRLLLVPLLVVLGGHPSADERAPLVGAPTIAASASEADAPEPIRDRASTQGPSEVAAFEGSSDIGAGQSESPDPGLVHASRFFAVPAPSRGISFGPRTLGSGHGPDRARPAEERRGSTDLREARPGVASEVRVLPRPTSVLFTDRYPRPPPAFPHFG